MQYPNIAQPQYGFAPTMMAAGGKVQAENVRAQGRNNDSMLVHMTPREVGGLQALAMQHGGSLTINPKTGLPEADFLESILPTLLGIGGTFLGIPPHLTAMAVGGIQTARTGDLGKGLMAGLGAFGGANLAGSFGAAGAAGAGGAQGASAMLGVPEAAGGAASTAGSQASMLAAENAAMGLTPTESLANIGSSAGYAAKAAVPSVAQTAATQAGQGLQNIFASGDTGTAAREAFLKSSGGYSGLATDVGMAAAPTMVPKPYKEPKPEKSTYEGPYTPTPREVRFPTADQRRDIGTSEFQYFTDVNPVPGFQPFSATQSAQAAPSTLPSTSSGLLASLTDEEKRRMMGETAPFMAAKGGSVPMLENGGFVLTKKAVDGLGRGSNKKGQKVASRGLGAIPIKGPGTGTSDSIKTSIDGKRPALVSNGEAYVPKKQVAKKGGAKAFYALMKKAEKAADKRKRA